MHMALCKSHNHAFALEGDAAMNVASLKAKSEDSHLETFCISVPLLKEATAVFIRWGHCRSGSLKVCELDENFFS